MTSASRLLPILGLALLVAPLHAAVPVSLNYQGYLTLPDGAAVDSTTPVPIEFRLYAVASEGTPVWLESQAVTVVQGLVSVTLGADPQNPFPTDTFDTPLFLGIAVDGDPEMTPRRPITSVAFSFSADHADRLQGRSAEELDQSADVAALAANTVIALDGILTQGGGGEVMLTAPGVVSVRNDAAGPDLELGGPIASDSGDNGVLASAQFLPSSDLIFESNDDITLDLDRDGSGENADFQVRVANQVEIFNIEKDGQVRLHGATSLRAGDDAVTGPIIALGGDASDQVESGRIRFLEGTASNNWRGGYVHYDGSANTMHLGVHDTGDDDPAMDREVLSIERSTAQVGINTISPTRELTVNDSDANGDAIVNMTATGREMLVGVNQSTGGLIAMQTNNGLQFRTNGTSRMNIEAGGDVQVLNNLMVEGQPQRDYGTGQYKPFAPFARGTVTDDGSSIGLVGTTANVASVGHVSVFHEVTLTNPCDSGGGIPVLNDYQLIVTPVTQIEDHYARVVCVSNKVVLRIGLRGAFGSTAHAGFGFVVFGP